MVETNQHPVDKITSIETSFAQIMKTLGLDLSDDSLADTPKRVAKMFVNEIFWGLDYKNFPKCTVIENKMRYDEMVIEKDITMISSCEHHFVVIDGKAHIAYIPRGKVLGLSKLNRIVEFFARRPQVQERIAEQVYHALEFILGTPDVAVVIEGVHYCVKSRGVEDHSSSTITSKLGGCFKEDPSVRAEFMSLIHSRSYNR
jgi:GTP cyclohydrolase I